MPAKRKHDYREMYLFAKEYGKEATMDAFGASKATVGYVISIGDALTENRPIPKDAKTLDKYSPRELMQELARRGYEGRLTYKQVIDINNF